jgi:multidrug resistance efflux pump
MIDLDENQNKLKEYLETQPKELISLNNNYYLSLKPMSKGGSYSDREIEYTKGELDKIENDIIKATLEERKKKNDEKLKGVKEEAENMMKAIKEQYDISKDNIMAKDAMGKIF